MKYKKCPNCELNYIKEDEELCEVCKSALNVNSKENHCLKDTKRKEIIKAGDFFPLSKNGELINYLTGSKITSWRRATYQLTNTCYMWIIALDGKARDGWRDVMLNDGRIKESYVGDKENLPSNFALTFDVTNKAVFEKDKDGFTFRGIYKLSEDTNLKYERYYVKVSDTTTLRDF